MIDLAIITVSLADDRVAGSIASLTSVAETEAGLASGLNNPSFQIGGAGRRGDPVHGRHVRRPRHQSLAALTDGYRSAFAVAIAIAVAALGAVAAGLLLGSRREPDVVAAPAVA
jgi:hypothetical protein